MKHNVIFIHGAPGAGKDTNAVRFVADNPGTIHISMGDVYRMMGTEDFKSQYKEILLEDVRLNKNSSAETTSGIFFESIIANQQQNYLITGFPHHIEEFEIFNKKSEEYNIVKISAIYLHITKTISIQRMTNRGLRPYENQKMLANESAQDYYSRRFEYYSVTMAEVIKNLGQFMSVNHINACQKIDAVYNDFSMICSRFFEEKR